MNHKARVNKLESKLMPGNGLHVIFLEEDETNDHAIARYCAVEGIPLGDLENCGPDSQIILVDKYCSGSLKIKDAQEPSNDGQ